MAGKFKYSKKFGGKIQITFGQLEVFFEPANWEIGRVLHVFEKINFRDVIHLRKNVEIYEMASHAEFYVKSK